MPSPWKVWPCPSLSSSTSFLNERSMSIPALDQRPRQPQRDRGHEEHERQYEQAHDDVGDHRAEDVTHRDLGRRHALHGHEKEAVRRQQEPQLHADQEHHAEPHGIDAQILHQRHENGQGDHHHAHLLDEEPQEYQHEHHRRDERKRREAELRDDPDQAVARPGEREDLGESQRADDDEEDHPRNPRRAAQRLQQVLERDRPVRGGQDHREERADGSRLGRRRPARRHPGDHHHEYRDERHHVLDERPQLFPAAVFLEFRAWRERGIQLDSHDDVYDEGETQHQARHDSADQQFRNRDAGEAPEQHRQRRGWNQHVHRADRHQRPGGHGGVIAAREHHRQHQAPQHRGGRDGRTRDRRNDSLGHSAGDRLLQNCAKRLTECLRESDIVARLGGDEFVVMIENFTGPRDAIAVAQKILHDLAKPFFVDGQEFLMSASIGISTFPDDGADVETLVKNADIAMYRAKDQGRNNYQFYSAQMNKHTFERLAMESSLRRAVERNEFLLHYQPKLDLRTGAIAGVEALVRWKHPDWGMVSPAQFIPLAEETGLIVQIGEWVLKTACEQSRQWRDQGIPALRVAVNLSARQFTQKTLLSDVAKTIAQSGLTPDCIELEITESLVMTNPEHATETLHKLKTMGISLSIDDFGTGYSSLAYLKRF